ncbi:MAG: hypothetical protein UU76_C0012G0021 [Parcubacteria group bacterium GW2011_GWC1_41_7]|nr:MAG: hypothetical protein UU76_C0012G0021 [Parcubacteria group bacterium GW2011_GWC1_41_7]
MKNYIQTPRGMSDLYKKIEFAALRGQKIKNIFMQKLISGIYFL